MKKYLILLILILASSCSRNVKGSWSCPILEGGGKGNCVSIGEVDLQLNNNAINSTALPDDYTNSEQKIKINLIAPKLADLKKIEELRNKLSKNTNSTQNITDVDLNRLNSISRDNKKNKLRTEEKVGKVWFAPYIDSDGNQHGESVIYVVDEKSRWVSQR